MHFRSIWLHHVVVWPLRDITRRRCFSSQYEMSRVRSTRLQHASVLALRSMYPASSQMVSNGNSIDRMQLLGFVQLVKAPTHGLLRCCRQSRMSSPIHSRSRGSQEMRCSVVSDGTLWCGKRHPYIIKSSLFGHLLISSERGCRTLMPAWCASFYLRRNILHSPRLPSPPSLRTTPCW